MHSKSGKHASQSTRSAKTKKSASAFRTISEVATELDVQQHVLRFWETKFSQVKPMKRGGGRRYYRPEDVDLLKAIHTLLYDQGYTIKGVQKLLSVSKNKVLEKLNDHDSGEPILTSDIKSPVEAKVANQPTKAVKSEYKDELKSMLDELKSLRSMLHV